MNLVHRISMHIFGHPRGILGRVGGLIMARTNHPMVEQSIDFLNVRPGETILEAGFGPGVGVQRLASSTSAAWIAGVDTSAEMHAQARARNAAELETGRVTLRDDSVEGLTFADATFDKALVIKSLQVWPDASAGLREIRRVLRPGGNIVLGLTFHSGQTKQRLTEMLTTAGFTDPQVLIVAGELYALASAGSETGDVTR